MRMQGGLKMPKPRRPCVRIGCKTVPEDGRSKLCQKHLNERNIREVAEKSGAEVIKKGDGSFALSTTQRKRSTKKTLGKNVQAVKELRSLINGLDRQAKKRFSSQIALAETLAKDLDNDIMNNATAYRTLLQNITDRMDKIYGTKNLDVVARMQMMIDENAKKRAVVGW